MASNSSPFPYAGAGQAVRNFSLLDPSSFDCLTTLKFHNQDKSSTRRQCLLYFGIFVSVCTLGGARSDSLDDLRHEDRPHAIAVGCPHRRSRRIALTTFHEAITTAVVLFYHMLDLRSKARQQLLAYYFTNPTARHHLRDLAERLSIDPSNLSKELGRLERDGLFRSEVIGR
jgi:hypothetical protein